MKAIVLIGLLLLVAGSAQAATLKEQYRDKNNDLICVYEKHFHRVTVNVGFNGHCSFHVDDDKL